MPHDLPKATQPRAGISLLEVLISMFVLLFGLMGVAAMFPAGAHHAGRARQFDTASAVGLAAYEDIRIRGLIRRLTDDLDGDGTDDNWLRANGTPLGLGNPSDVTVWPVVCDPARLPNGQFSPVWQIAAPTLQIGSRQPLSHLLPKNLVVPIPAWPAAVSAVPAFAMQSRHDLVLQLPDDADLPARDQDPSSSYRQFQGEYSWIFTVAPVTGAQQSYVLDAEHVTVSVAVFRRRIMENEWTAQGVTIQGGFGGGEAWIADGSGSTERLEQIRGGDWVLVTDPRVGTNPPPTAFVKWCRIVGADEIDTSVNPPVRVISLAGTDWDPSWTRANVTLFDRVIAVYEKVVRLESSSSWSYW